MGYGPLPGTDLAGHPLLLNGQYSVSLKKSNGWETRVMDNFKWGGFIDNGIKSKSTAE